MTALAPALQAYFTDRLIGQRAASPNTIGAYKLTFRLLLTFASKRLAKTPAALDIAELDAPLIAAFLDHLERDRRNSAATRNNRLAAIHSLFGYLALHHPEHAGSIARVLAIPPKRTERNLSPTSPTPRSTRCWTPATRTPGPDGAITPCSRSPSRPVCGSPSSPDSPAKTSRSPSAPTCTPSAKAAKSDARRSWRPPKRSCTRGSANVPALQAIRCSRPSPAAASAATRSNGASPTTSLSPRRLPLAASRKQVTMHTLRHTTAMRLLLAGNDVTVIALWLGHEQIATTNIYLHADMTHKQQAIDRTKPLATKPGRYRPPDSLLAFLEAL